MTQPVVKLPSEPSRVVVNKNVEWLREPGIWLWYILILLAGWLILSCFVDPGLAWSYVHIIHGLITYVVLHCMKGSPIVDDQGKYDSLTFWEQLDDGIYNTATRKFLTIMPVLLFLLALNTADFGRQPLVLNLVIVAWLLVAKFPAMHGVRLFGINKY